MPESCQRVPLVAKIETPRVIADLPSIIVAAAGRQPTAVMITRGDLSVEIGFERLAEMQEELLWLCEAAHVPVIWVTQVLEQLVKNGLPSRGEMTDAAMAVRAEAVMLNKGPFVVEGVSALDRLLTRMADHQEMKTPKLRSARQLVGRAACASISSFGCTAPAFHAEVALKRWTCCRCRWPRRCRRLCLNGPAGARAGGAAAAPRAALPRDCRYRCRSAGQRS